MGLTISFGFDCDYPRGIDFIRTQEGKTKLDSTVKGLEFIRDNCNRLRIPRTYFICGQFLNSIIDSLGLVKGINLFEPNSNLVEIGNHTWDHQVIIPLKSRPDKVPMTKEQRQVNIEKTNKLIEDSLGLEMIYGFRTPLGHPSGLHQYKEILNELKSLGFVYISSWLRDKKGSINPKLVKSYKNLRQPFYYPNRLLEIPTHGWHDTAFTRNTKTKLFSIPPHTYFEIINYYKNLFFEAGKISKTTQVFNLALVLHPSEILTYARYDFFDYLFEFSKELTAKFVKYIDICRYAG